MRPSHVGLLALAASTGAPALAASYLYYARDATGSIVTRDPTVDPAGQQLLRRSIASRSGNGYVLGNILIAREDQDDVFKTVLSRDVSLSDLQERSMDTFRRSPPRATLAKLLRRNMADGELVARGDANHILNPRDVGSSQLQRRNGFTNFFHKIIHGIEKAAHVIQTPSREIKGLINKIPGMNHVQLPLPSLPHAPHIPM